MSLASLTTSLLHNVKNLRIYFIRNLAFSAEDLFLPIHSWELHRVLRTPLGTSKEIVFYTLVELYRHCYILQSTFFLVCTLATNVPTLVYLRLYRKFYWLRFWKLVEPHYETLYLLIVALFQTLVEPVGVEPTTFTLQG